MFSIIDDDVQRNELEKFYKENLNCFLNIAYLKLHNKYDAEDAVQEAFSEIVRKPDNFFSVAPKNRVNFMVAVVRNISSDMFNKKNKVPLEELVCSKHFSNKFYSGRQNTNGCNCNYDI